MTRYDAEFRRGVLLALEEPERARGVNPSEYDRGFHDGVEYGLEHCGVTEFFTRWKLRRRIKKARADEIKRTVRQMEEEQKEAKTRARRGLNPEDPVEVEKKRGRRLWAAAVKRIEKQIAKIQTDEDATKAIRAFERAEDKAWSLLGREGADERAETTKRLRAAAIKAREEAAERRIKESEAEARRIGQEIRERRRKEWWRNNPEENFLGFGKKKGKRFKFRAKGGKTYEWSYAELADTIFEGEHWDKASVKKRVRGLKVGQKVTIRGETLTRINPRIRYKARYRVMRLVEGAKPEQYGDLVYLSTAMKTYRMLKRGGLTTWLETEKGEFYPVKGAMRKYPFMKNPAASVPSRPNRDAPIYLKDNRRLWKRVHGSARRIYTGPLAKFARRAADKVVADAEHLRSWSRRVRMPNPGDVVFLGQLVEMHVLGDDGNIVVHAMRRPPPILWSPSVRRDKSEGSVFAFAGMRHPNPAEQVDARAEEAAELFRAWNAHDREPRGVSRARVPRPTLPAAVPAIAVVYRSDKFTPNPVEYIHHFEEGVRCRTDGRVYYVTGGRLKLTERGLEK